MDRAWLDDVVARALTEDLGAVGDITSEAIFAPGHVSTARIVARQAGTIAGLPVAGRVFTTVDPAVDVEPWSEDGTTVEAGTVLMRLEGPTRALLAAERTALNLLGRMSGTATATAELVGLVEGTGTRIADTRKTTPTLRALDRYAVRMGGGTNHRFGLHDAVLIKDNHISAAGGVGAAVGAARARVGHTVKVEVEVDTLDQLDEVLAVGADIVLLDNMDLAELAEAVCRVDGRMIVEASGGIDRGTVRAVAETGVDVISVGAVTHSASTLDVALDLP